MPEIINKRNVFSLNEFLSSISRCISQNYNRTHWIKVEIAKLNFFQRSGCCYPELVENKDGINIATASGFISRLDYQRINGMFLQKLGDPLSSGMQVLIECRANFSTTKGFKLNIFNIDIESILGSQALANIECINKLKTDGVFLQNKRLSLPRLIKRLAIVSVVTSKGYADFCSIIDGHSDLHISYTLISANLAGNNAVSELISALNAVFGRRNEFDAVCIIRGGGGVNTLQCFNNYELSSIVAKFPLPVLTGIGHATNQTVVEQVCNRSFVSPSELANFIVNTNLSEVQSFNQIVNHITTLISSKSKLIDRNLGFKVSNFKMRFKYALTEKSNNLDSVFNKILSKQQNIFHDNTHKINTLSQIIINRFSNIFHYKNNKVSILESEFMQRLFNQVKVFVSNKPVKSVSDVKIGDSVNFFTDDGIVVLEVKEIIRK